MCTLGSAALDALLFYHVVATQAPKAQIRLSKSFLAISVCTREAS